MAAASGAHHNDDSGTVRSATHMDSPDPPLTLDLIIPLYNEAEVLDLLFDTLDRTFCPDNLARRNVARVRYLFVDDGSSDSSASIIAERIRAGAPAALYRLSRNFGHANAVSAGLDHATADLVAVIDADLQDPPAVVLEMIDLARQGHNVVFGQRRKRKEHVLKRAGYWTFYRLVAFLSDIKIPLDTGDFCLIDRQVVMALRSLPERLRYPRVLRAWVGFRQTGVEYDRPERQAGVSKYPLSKLYRLGTDGIAAASIRPLKIAQFSSFLFGLVAVALMAMFILMLAGQLSHTLSWPFLLVSLLIASGHALTMLCLYVFSAYLGRMYLEVKGRPPYIIMEAIVGDETNREGPPR
jgi:dolichol-phosphate mannosyltransferase